MDAAKRSEVDGQDADKDDVIVIHDTGEKIEVDAVFLKFLYNRQNTKKERTITKSRIIKQPPNSKRMTSPPSIANCPVFRHRSHQQIFSDQQEEELSTFVRDASDYYNGMTSKDVRILAFVYGVCNQVDLPIGWRNKHEASLVWCSGFTKRNKLSLSVSSNRVD